MRSYWNCLGEGVEEKEAQRSFWDAAKQRISFEFDIICAWVLGMSGCSKEADKNDDDHDHAGKIASKARKNPVYNIQLQANSQKMVKIHRSQNILAYKQDFKDNKYNE